MDSYTSRCLCIVKNNRPCCSDNLSCDNLFSLTRPRIRYYTNRKPAFLTGFRSGAVQTGMDTRHIWLFPSRCNKKGSEGVFGSTERNPTKHNAVTIPICAAAIEDLWEMRAGINKRKPGFSGSHKEVCFVPIRTRRWKGSRYLALFYPRRTDALFDPDCRFGSYVQDYRTPLIDDPRNQTLHYKG